MRSDSELLIYLNNQIQKYANVNWRKYWILLNQNISKHLTILHNAGIIEKRKEGRWTFAYISKSLDTFMAKILDAFIRIQGEIIKFDIGKASRINNGD